MSATRGVDDVLEDLRRSMREAPTLPDMPEDADADERSRAYANLALATNDRLRRVAQLLDLQHEENKVRSDYVDGRLGRIERSLAELVTLLRKAP